MCASTASPRMRSGPLWTALLLILVICAALHTCQVSADTEADTDLVIDIDDPISQKVELNNLHKEHRRIDRRHTKTLLEKELSSAEPQDHKKEDEHWLTKTVRRIKRAWWNPFASSTNNEEEEEEKVDSREKRNSKEEELDEDTTTQSHENQHQDQNEDQLVDQFNEEDEGQSSFNEELNEVLPAHRPSSHSQHRFPDDDEDNTISGSGIPIGETSEKPTEAGHKDSPRYYRATLTVQEPYRQNYDVRTSFDFRSLANPLQEAIAQIYKSLPGTQSATVIRIQKRSSDQFTSLVTVDIGTMDYYDSAVIKERLFEQIQNYQRIGDVPISTEDFTFREFDVTAPSSCNADELLCRSGECVPIDARCNDIRECKDGSDEAGCTAVTSTTTPKISLNEIDPDAEDGDDDYDDEITENPQYTSHTTKKSTTHESGSTTTEYFKSTVFDLATASSVHHTHHETSTSHHETDDDLGRAETDDDDLYSYPNGHSNGHSYSHQENSSITRTSSHHITPPLRHTPSGSSHSFSSNVYHPDGSYNQSSSSASGSHSQGSHSRETIHAETNKHRELEFNNTFNYSIDLGGEHSVFKNRSVHVLATNQSHSHGGYGVDVVTGSGVETITTATLSPEDNFPVPVPNPIDRCRADDKVRCGDSSIFICTDQECDGHSDCPNGEDEADCPIEECATGEFMCDVTRCIQESKVCDSVADCNDRTDEHNCPLPPCAAGTFQCNDGKCIDESQKCDGRRDCYENEDENNCPACNRYQFTCGNGECIDSARKCDGRRDCLDGSDESERECAPCDIRCGDGRCVPESARCNTIFDCADGIDEANCTLCSPYQYRCNNRQCIDENRRCDGRQDCSDGSDEVGCVSECPGNQFRCYDGLCLDERRRCDGHRDCRDGSDELNCPPEPESEGSSCLSNQFRCTNGVCIADDFHCDGFPDCTDGSDEKGCSSCTDEEFECSDHTCIPNYLKCDGRRDCAEGNDEKNCPKCPSYEFSCGDGHCLPRDRVCDKNYDCSDGRDEQNCGCSSNEFTCQSGECIVNSLKCNGHQDCYDGSDERDCPKPTEAPYPPSACGPGQWKCHSGECIPLSAFCNSRVDCNDYSDENNCPTTSGLNLKTYPDDQIIKESREVVFQCRDEGPLRARVHWVRGNNQPLPPGSRDINGRLEMPDIQVEHTGTYICEAIGYPTSTPGSRVSVSLTVEPFEQPSTRPPQACGLHEATCSNGDCIPKSQVCDGNFDCTDGSDETRCNQHGCEPNEFRCANKRCVLKTWRCDSDDDCGDNSDEENCATNPPGSPCRFNEFQCRSGNQCIPKSFHCDLERDCVDGSDEIGCSPVYIQKPPPPMVTLDPGAVFEITCTAVGVPTPEVIWRLNWGHIPEKCITKSENGFGTLTCPNIQEHDQGAYSCEAINVRGSVFAVPDSILVVKRGGKVCSPGFFNREASHPHECIKCFCFGVTSDCDSADLFTYQLHPPLDIHKIVGVRVEPNGVVEVRDEPIYRGAQPTISEVGSKGLHFATSPYSNVESNIVPYFAMPENYNNNQLKSYGGYMKYKVRYTGPRGSNTAPDVILKGNGYTLLHTGRQIQPDRESTVSVRFFAGEWIRRSDNAPEQLATREEIMMALAAVENILIKLQYNNGPQIDTTLSNIEMDSAAVRNTGQGRAAYVEECRCPVGYTGLSCENCAAGYVRHMSGPWLGKCYKEEEKCQPGYYGDPSRGIPCEICPCPLTNPSNQFARTCSLGSDGQVVCDCPPGYVGKRCEQCAAGYSGNPLIAGDSCKAGICDASGAMSTLPEGSGQCPCKLYTHGPTCNTCKPNTFNLSPVNQFGCIACFCMGITRECTSSNWYRDQLSTAFTRSRNDFKLVESQRKKEYIEDGIRVNTDAREIVFDEFSRRTPDVYYWSLPSRYLGDKVTSYGGNLRYTLRYVPAPGGLSSRNTAPDVEIISSNDITLLYFGREHPQPNNAQTFTVPLLEQHWQRSDGKAADREHLLMALADLEAILIKATYTTNTREAALISVSLDIADDRNTGLERALSVEQCLCPAGYRGLSCEDCDVGYTRGKGGIYLGLCEPCNCNGHSSECDPETGECQNCADHTTGEYCDQCVPGYEGDATHGTPQDCRPTNTGGHTCFCDERGSTSTQCYGGSCSCKPNVEGPNCNSCRKGTFGLSASNPEGCSECFCSGVTDQCGESNLYTEQIPSQIIDNNHGFTLTDETQQERISDGFQLNVGMNEISYNIRPSQNTRLFWSLPRDFTGDKIASYGGRLEFMQRYTNRPHARYYPDKDIIIIGNGVTIYWSNPEGLIVDRPNNVSVVISTAENWQRLEHHTGPRRATRDDILTALANVEAILIRGSQSSDTSSTYISDITLDTAVPQYTGQGRAIHVESCRCPPGYRGTSCELCSSGYYRDINDRSAGPLGSCQRCPCGGNEQSCLLGPSNRVVCNCRPGYYGSRCETTDLPTPPPYPTPRPTPGQPTIEVSITTPTIGIVDVGSTLRLRCNARSLVSSPVQVQWSKDGGVLPRDRALDDHKGVLVITDVRVSDSGVYICQASDGSSIVTESITITVGNQYEPPRVHFEPQYLNVQEGDPIEIRCIGTGNPAPYLQFTGGQNNRLNPEHTFINGIFRIPYARKSDEAEYRCTAENSAGSDTQTTYIYVRGGSSEPETSMVPIIRPDHYSGPAGRTFNLTCSASQGRHTIIWYRMGAPVPYSSSQNHGILTVYNPKPEDSGVYVCNVTSVSGESGTDTARVTITSTSTQPTVRIEPDRQTIAQGTTAELRCIATGSPAPSVKWTKVGEEFGPNVQETGQYLRITNTQVRDRGVYVCIASNDAGLAQSSAILEVEQREPPAIEIYPSSSQTVTVGGSAILQCRVTSGIPSPKVWWTRQQGQQLTRNTEELSGGVLRFTQITMEETGEYICHAQNDAGQTTASARIDVQSFPVLTISPRSGQITVREGERVRLECSAVGHPQPTVQWSKYLGSYARVSDSLLTGEINQIAVYEITSVSKRDEGHYVCLGKNSAGAHEERVYLTVDEQDRYPTRGDNPGGETDQPEDNYPPTQYPNTGYPVHPTSDPRNPLVLDNEFVVPLGARAEMRCRIQDYSNNQIFLNWIRADNSSLPSDSFVQNGILYIDNVQPSAAGVYHCLGISNGRILFTAPAHLKIIAPPRIVLAPPKQTVRPGDTAYINCHAEGDQPIDIRWSAMGRPLPHSVLAQGGQLKFFGIQVSDAGRYICSAKNAAGEADAVAEVVVNEHVAEYPTITAEDRVVNAVAGKTVHLRCRLSQIYSGSPPNIHWTHNRQNIPHNALIRGETLQLTNIQKSDAGRYTCEVYNEHGSSSDYIDLVVNDPYAYAPQRLEIHPSSEEHHLGDTLDLECVGADSGHVQWSKSNDYSGRLADNVHQSGHMLRIISLRPENSGIYKCASGDRVAEYDLSLIDAPLHADEPTVSITKAPQGSNVIMDCSKTDLLGNVNFQWTKQGGTLPRNINSGVAKMNIRDVKYEDAGTYICTQSNGQVTLELPHVLVITGVVPFFPQTPVSYIALPTIPDSYLHFSFEVSFKPETPNGIILYNGQKKNSPTGDFISLVLNDGYPEFRFSCGVGPAVIRGDQRLELGQWHTIKVTRARREGKMFVNGRGPFSGQSPGRNQGLDLMEQLFVGGVPSINDISPQAGSSSGFVGCISRVIIGRLQHDLMRDAITKEEVTTCETCTGSPCNNNGVCQEAQQKEGYSCICPAGFSGPTCNKVGEACYPDACGSGRCVDKEEGYDCYCPLGKIGKHCERDVDIYEPAFSNNAFVAYPTPSIDKRRLKMALKIKPKDLHDGVLLYSSESDEGYGNFASLSIKNGHIEFRFDVGSGPVIIRSSKQLVSNEWVAVTVSRYLGEGKLIVNGEPAVTGRTVGTHKPLNLLTPLYVGGYDQERITLNSGVGVQGGFHGCVSDIDVSGLNLNLIESVTDSANVQDCSDINNNNGKTNEIQYGSENEHSSHHNSQVTGCTHRPCRNDGLCFPLSPTEYRCTCINGYTGTDCEIAPNLCDHLKPCQSGGTCNGTTTHYNCDCPLGYTGINCEQRAEIRSDVHFSGNGYLELDRTLLPHDREEESELIALELSTNSSDGLIFWHGQTPRDDGTHEDYISLALVDGYLEFSYDLGNNPVTIRNEKVRIDDGHRHSVVLKRLELDGSIEIDHDYTEFGQAEGLARTMNCRGNIYLGGTPNISFMTGDRFSRGFVGCIHGFELQDSQTMDLGTKALSGLNVRPCSSWELMDNDDDDDDGEEIVNK